MIEEHLKRFEKDMPQALKTEQWVGNNIRRWWEQYVCKHTKAVLPEGNLPNDKMSRNQLKAFCHKDSKREDWECLAAVMAWGGQNRKHGVMLFDRFEEIKPIIHSMRHEKISPLEAYDEFYKVWLKPERLGMGAAYFTKLIFFCEPSHKGYIMDQWTSKSVNLLKGEDVVHLSYGYVNKKNTAHDYEHFCDFTDQIADKLNQSGKRIKGEMIKGEDVEIAMFSRGGRESQKWDWRKYVVKQTTKQKAKA